MIDAETRVEDLQAAGYDGLCFTCPACRRTVCYPFRLLLGRRLARSGTRVAVLAARIRCQECRHPAAEPPKALSPWRISDGSPDMNYLGRPAARSENANGNPSPRDVDGGGSG